jgi:hypothetical protein
MFAWLNIFNPELLSDNPWLLLPAAFQVWMLVDALRRGETYWAFWIFIFPVFNAILYFFLVYRPALATSSTTGFELPGTQHRRRIRELQAQIHHLDKAHHHAELGDVYFAQGKLSEAEASYRAAIKRDATDVDFHAHLGQCLLRQGRADEARPLLEKVVSENPKHDYGHTLMGYAEALARLGHKDDALRVWEQVLQHHSYARARVQAAELSFEKGDAARAKTELTELIADETHAVSFERKRDKFWVKKAKALLKQISAGK